LKLKKVIDKNAAAESHGSPPPMMNNNFMRTMDAGPISTRDLYSFSNISPNRGEPRKGQASRNHQ